jgi:hypothetical protein
LVSNAGQDLESKAFEFDFNADSDPDPAFHSNVNPVPDSASKYNVDPTRSGSGSGSTTFHRDETWRAECRQTMVVALFSTKPDTGRALEALD